MNERKRLLEDKIFPPYIFIPGKNPHPSSYMEGDPIVKPLISTQYDESDAYLYAIDLINFGYYWEAHVWLEALWNIHNRKGEMANFLKGLIKICAAGVKIRLENDVPVIGHLVRAIELFEGLGDEELAGLEISELIIFCNEIISNIDNYMTNEDTEPVFKELILQEIS